jgi:hypothetical protein
MYQPGVRHLSGFVDDLTSIISAGASAYRTATAPSFNPQLAPYQGPNIDPRTGAYVPAPGYFNVPQPATNYTVPLLIGGGLLIFLAMRKK